MMKEYSAQERLAILRDVERMESDGWTLVKACRAIDIKPGTISRWRALYVQGGIEALADGKSTGRPALCDWPAEDVQEIRETYLKTNRGDGIGSMSHAVRRCVFENKLSHETTQVLKRPAASKHYIPSSLRKELEIAPAVIRHHRSPRNATLSGPYVPGSTRLTSDGSRRLYAGERFSFDDASQNQVVVVPWPYGGSKEADKYGHRTCRGQWLVAHDDATSKIVGWVFTLRPRDSYRDPDALGLMYRVARDVCRPDEAVCEGGVWQSKRATAFHRAANIRVVDAKGRPHLKLVENWFNRGWTHLSVYEDGQIGRFRGEYERENKLLARARQGTLDAREYFPLLPDLLRELDECVRFMDHDPVESREYGRWIPIERWEADLAEHPRDRLDDSLAPYAAPECHDVTVRRGGMVVCNTTCPLGIPAPYSFAHEDLAKYEGRRVRVLYDPFEAVVNAAIFDLKTREPICLATCMNPPPAPVAAQDWQILRDYAAVGEAIQVKKAMADAVRSEYRALGGGKRRISEQRGPDGVARIDQDLTRGAEGSPDVMHPDRRTSSAGLLTSRRAVSEPDSDRLSAEADELEAKLKERGDLITIPSGKW